MDLGTTGQARTAILGKTGQCQCGTPIYPRFTTCYKCYEKRTENFTNRCANCGKPIDNKYSLCYQCNEKTRAPVPT